MIVVPAFSPADAESCIGRVLWSDGQDAVQSLGRNNAFGMIAEVDVDQWVDVLDEKGDILHEIPVTIQGFKYLRRTLKFVREQ